ncbi:hypothetical protein P4C99_00810 [Pontiellaceae bacterium B1224]|nr:hypothetical protein [Pontiellaceae bacterium B1224]
MKKRMYLVISILLGACGPAIANFSGGDDFNDNSMDGSKWSVFEGTADRSLIETNGRLEMNSTGNPIAEPDWDTGVWKWEFNGGSTTQDWTITYDTVNLLDENTMSYGNDMWFGIFVSRAENDFENGCSIEINKSNFGSPNHEVDSAGSVDDDEVLDAEIPVTNDYVTLRIQYDAFLQRLYCSYDEGNGFMDLGSMSIGAWDMGATDEFQLYLYGGGETNTPVASGQVYGDNLVLVPTSEYVEPETIIGYHNFSGSDDFNDNSIDGAKWSHFHNGANAAFTEINGRFEFTSPSPGGDEDSRSDAWEWIANQGSYTQSWTITYRAVNTINATNLPAGDENWFGLAVLPDSTSFDEAFDISVGKENYNGSYPLYEVGSEATDGGETVINYNVPVSNESIMLRLSYDALTHTLYSSYDEGSGFITLTNMDASVWGMDADDRFTAVFYSGNNGMIVTSGQLYAENVILEPSADHLNESGAELASHINDIEIYAGYNFATGFYELEFDLWSDGTFSEVYVNAPFGTFDCEEDWQDWEYDLRNIPTNAVPDIDGDWQIVVVRTNGLSSTTTIPFTQADGVTPMPEVTTCPSLTAPILPSNTWVFAQDVTFTWDSDFDSNANLAGIDAWNEVSDADVEFATYTPPFPVSHSSGIVNLEAGLAEIWLFNLFEVEETNADGVAYQLGRYAYRPHFVTVIDPEWDEDLDGMSNEWEFDYFGGITAGDASADSDGDGCDDLTEFRNGTDPTNPASCSSVTLSANFASDEVSLGWSPASGREYDVYWTADLMDDFELMAAGLAAPQSAWVSPLFDAGFYRLDIWRTITSSGAVPRKEIDVGNDLSDWSGIAAQLTDPSGDHDYSGLDITGITVAQGVSNLFFRIDRAGIAGVSSNDSSGINIDLRAGGRGSDYYLNMNMGMYGTNAWFASTFGETNHTDIASSYDNSISMEFVGNAIEIAVPLEPMEPIDRYGLGFSSYASSNGNYNVQGLGDWDDHGSVIIMPY